jgi:hypothetical protein
MKKKKLLTLVLAMLPLASMAQSDAGLWTSIGLDKKINKKISVGIEGEFRSRNDFRTAERWSIGLDATYKINKKFKVAAGYVLLNDNRKEKISYNNDDPTSANYYNNWRPSYWTIRHRVFAGLGWSFDAGRWAFSLRERWQYTYRPEKTTTRYDFDNAKWEDTTVNGKAGSVLRSRVQAEYDIPACTWTPYASVELYNAWSVEKVRYTIGADWKINKKNSFGVYYRFQDDRSSSDDDDADMNIFGLSYNFKF